MSTSRHNRPSCYAPGLDLTEPHKPCGRPAAAHGLCAGHYRWARRHPGEPLQPLGPPREERKARRVVQVRISRGVLAVLRDASADEGRPNLRLATAASEALEEWAEEWRPKSRRTKEQSMATIPATPAWYQRAENCVTHSSCSGDRRDCRTSRGTRPGDWAEDVRAIQALPPQDAFNVAEGVGVFSASGRIAISRWHRSAAEAGDTELVATIDRLGEGPAAEIYEQAAEWLLPAEEI